MINKNTFKVIDSNDVHQYDIIVTEETIHNQDYPITYSLHASNGAEWSHEAKGKLFLTIIDTGDAYVLNKSIKRLEYDFAEELVILIKFINYHYTTIGGVPNRNYRVIECINITDL